MPNSTESADEIRAPFDPAIQTENIEFLQEELLTCDGCSRQNPPNRINCIYCGTVLAISAEQFVQQKPVIRKLESWEQGFNIVCLSSTVEDRSLENKIASLTGYDTSDVNMILSSSAPLPILRVESSQVAEMLSNEFNGLGLTCCVVSDADLAAERPPVRLAKIDISKTSFQFIDFNTKAAADIAFLDLALIVRGQLSRTRTELVEKRKRKRTDLLDESSSFADETVIDLYTKSDGRGFRINIAGFDFSCLGAEKTLLAKENIGRLIKLLSDLAPNARLADNFSTIQGALSKVWEIESRSDAQGIKHLRFGKSGFGKVESTSNLQQFTKYSRLLRHLL